MRASLPWNDAEVREDLEDPASWRGKNPLPGSPDAIAHLGCASAHTARSFCRFVLPRDERAWCARADAIARDRVGLVLEERKPT